MTSRSPAGASQRSFDAIVAMVSAGLGVSIVPRPRKALLDARRVPEVRLGKGGPTARSRSCGGAQTPAIATSTLSSTPLPDRPALQVAGYKRCIAGSDEVSYGCDAKHDAERYSCGTSNNWRIRSTRRVTELAASTWPPSPPSGGRIIVIGSTNGDRVPFAGGAAYALTKSAMQGMVRGLARDFGTRGITVNAVQPGPTDTEMNPANGPMAELMHSFMAIKRHVKTSEVAELVAFVAGPHGAMITGSTSMIDGGFAA